MKPKYKIFLSAASCILTLAIHYDPNLTAAEIPVPPVDVQVVNQPNVSVINGPKNPIAVGEMQNPAFKPFQVESRFSLGRGEGAAEAVLPGVGNANQRVVIEHVTVDAQVPDGQRAVAYINIGDILHSLVLTFQGNWGSSDRYRASQPIRLYSIGGGLGFGLAGVERNRTTGSASFYFTVSGYLVDLP